MNWHLTLTLACFAFAASVFATTWVAGYRKGQQRNRFRHYGRVLPKPRREAVVTRDSEWRVSSPRGYWPFESTPFGRQG